MTLDTRDGVLTLSFPYDEEMLATVREIRGRRWDPAAKAWTFPPSAIRPLRAFAERYDIAVTPAVDAMPDAAPVDRPTVGITAGRFTIRFDYDADLVARVREIPGARWDPKDRTWTAAVDAETEVGRFVVDTDSAIEPTTNGYLEDARVALAKVDASMSAEAEMDIPGLAGDLLPFQRAGVAYALAVMGR